MQGAKFQKIKKQNERDGDKTINHAEDSTSFLFFSFYLIKSKKMMKRGDDTAASEGNMRLVIFRKKPQLSLTHAQNKH